MPLTLGHSISTGPMVPRSCPQILMKFLPSISIDKIWKTWKFQVSISYRSWVIALIKFAKFNQISKIAIFGPGAIFRVQYHLELLSEKLHNCFSCCCPSIFLEKQILKFQKNCHFLKNGFQRWQNPQNQVQICFQSNILSHLFSSTFH